MQMARRRIDRIRAAEATGRSSPTRIAAARRASERRLRRTPRRSRRQHAGEQWKAARPEPPRQWRHAPSQNSKSSRRSAVQGRARTRRSSDPAPAKNLGESLRNLQRYLQDQNFNNPKGGLGRSAIRTSSSTRRASTSVRGCAGSSRRSRRNWFIPQAAMARSGSRRHSVLRAARTARSSTCRSSQPSAVEAFNDRGVQRAASCRIPTLPLPPEYPADRAFFTVTFHYNEGRP